MQMLQSSPEQGWVDKPGGVFLRRADLMPPEDQTLLQGRGARRDGRARTAACTSSSFVRCRRSTPLPARLAPGGASEPPTIARAAPDAGPLESFNGLGGFADDGREYVIQVHPDGRRDRPGAVGRTSWRIRRSASSRPISASGFTWSENSHDNRLTPWRNDPVSDPPGEAIFLRDEDNGRVWSATPLPAGGGRPTPSATARATRSSSTRATASRRAALFVPRDEPVKIFELALRNASARARRLSVTLYVEWVLGEHRSRTRLHVVTSREPATGAVLARNAFRDAFADRVAFVDLHDGSGAAAAGAAGPDDHRRSHRVHRTQRHAAVAGGACTATAVGSHRRRGSIRAAPSRSRHARAGRGTDADRPARRGGGRAQRRARWCSGSATPTAVDAAADDVIAFWDGVLGTVRSRRPSRSMDLMLNRWLLYQALACRIWGRSAFYQSSGAFGFRDQLQDALALLFSAPQLVRAPAAARRVAAVRRGGRPALVARARRPGRPDAVLRRPAVAGLRALHYVAATGDDAVLDEQVPFLEGRPARRRRARSLRAADGLERDGLAVRALRARGRAQPRRPARTACR